MDVGELKLVLSKSQLYIENLNNTVNQFYLIVTYRTLHPTTAEYTFFSGTHGTFTKIDNILSH